MSDQQSKTKQATQPKLQGEHLGVVLFLIGVLPLVLVGVAFFKGQVPGETQARGLAAAALRLVRAFGYFPSLVLFGGVSAVGAVLFLGNRLLAPGRHLLGLVGVSLGLAALLGSVQHLGGGRIGDALGGSLGRSMGPWAGVVVGVLIMGATAVLAWFGGSVPMPKKLGKGATLSTALSDLDRDGVSNAETHALAPDASTLKYMEELWRGTKPVVQVVPLPPSPYPEDVRLKGKIPEGASALPVAPKDAAKQPAEATPKEATESSDAVSANQSQGKPQGKHAAHRWDRGAKESAPEHPVDSDLGP
ncbi:MAG TPA: hypothetical protein P5218_02620, partial [Planctomycetota bacterium]|nr:hypothetical protein [Planctomycetota bacterium]